jgi:hypothetical protein
MGEVLDKEFSGWVEVALICIYIYVSNSVYHVLSRLPAVALGLLSSAKLTVRQTTRPRPHLWPYSNLAARTSSATQGSCISRPTIPSQYGYSPTSLRSAEPDR